MTTQLLVTSVLPFVATKPQSETQLFIVVNQNELETYGEIWVEAEASVTWQLDVGADSTRNQPMAYTLAPNDLLSVQATMDSEGLSADEHPIVIRVWAKTAESLRAHARQNTTFTVTSYAVANNTRAEVVGDPPVMGLQLWGDQQVRIYPYDADNQRIMSANPGIDVFDVQLSNQQTTDVIQCAAPSIQDYDPDFHYYASCVIPDLSKAVGAAGAWDLVVTLNGENIIRAPVDMWCPERYYEKPGSNGLSSCHECNVGDTTGAICSVAWDDFAMPSGTTREGIVLKKAYWRAGLDTDRIYPCSLDGACKGGDGSGNAEYCNEGYFGPFCSTCERRWFM